MTATYYVPCGVESSYYIYNLVNNYQSQYPPDREEGVFTKVRGGAAICRPDEVTNLALLQDSGVTPRLISHQILAEVISADEEEKYIIDMIRMQRLEGETLTEAYIPDDEAAHYGMGPGGRVTKQGVDLEVVKRWIPLKYIPVNIFNQVVEILTLLFKQYRLCYNDIHTGNFIVHQDKIYVIDLDGAIRI